MTDARLNKTTCQNDLVEYKALLDSADELDETTLGNFFISHPNLILLIGKMGFNFTPRLYQNEFNFFNEFYADFAVANQNKSQFIFVEFEDAKSDSIFKEIRNSRTVRHEWSEKFEHGYSQIINWFYRLDDYSKTDKIEDHFGVKTFNYSGILVIGRKKFIQHPGLKRRIEWRNSKVDVNKKVITCYTFDDLYEELKEKLEILNEEIT